MQVSLKQLIKEVRELCNAHAQIQSFHYGDTLSLLQKGAIDYTTCLMNVSRSPMGNAEVTFSIELLILDRVITGDDANQLDSENTTNRIVNDLINVIGFSTRWRLFSDLKSQNPVQKYYDSFTDAVTGWGVTINLQVYNTNGICDLPIFDYDFEQPIPEDDCDILVIAENTNSDMLATKIVSEGDNIILIPNINFTDGYGVTTNIASGVDITAPLCVSEIMTVDFSADKLTAGVGENITFTDLTDKTPTDWSWDFGDGTTSTSQNPVKNYSIDGTYDVSLMAGKVGLGNVLVKSNYITIETLFSPLDYLPTFWFDFNNYTLGVLAGVPDETGNHTATSVNGAEIVSEGGINVLECVKSSIQAVDYGSNFISVLSQPHTHFITYKPKSEISASLETITGNLGTGSDSYGIFQTGRKLRMFLRIGGITTSSQTVNDVIFSTNTIIIVVGVSQNLITIEVNGVSLLLTTSVVTPPSLLANIPLVSNLMIGARASNSLPSDAYYGDSLLFPRLLTPIEKTNLIDYFV